MSAEPTHAGGVVHRERDGRILLVRARPVPHDWVLPKGHIEKGETPEQTAVREVEEEAGVIAVALRALGMLEFEKPNGKPARVLCFLMRFVRETAAAEEREVGWWTFEEAISLTEFENTRAILEAARQSLAGR